MARTYSAETNSDIGASGPPVVLADASQRGFKSHKVFATITMASQASGDDIVLGRVRKGMRFVGATVIASATLATATIALGIVGSTAKYKAAAVFTAVDTPTPYGKASAIGVAETADALLLLTIGTAALPAAGTLVVILEFAHVDGG